MADGQTAKGCGPSYFIRSHSRAQRLGRSSTKLDSVALLKSQRVTIPIEMILLQRALVDVLIGE